MNKPLIDQLMKLHADLSMLEAHLARRTVPPDFNSPGCEETRAVQMCIEQEVDRLSRQ